MPTLTSPRNWMDYASYLLASIIAASGWYKVWKERRKPEADIELSDAQAELSRAEARKKDAEATKTYNDIIREINGDLREAETRRDEIRTEVDKERAEKEKYKRQVLMFIERDRERDAEVTQLRNEIEELKIKALQK